MRYIATLLGLIPALGFITPLPIGTEGGSLPDFSGTYNNCATIALLPTVPPQSIVIETSFDGGVNDVVITPGVGGSIPQVSHTFIADGIQRHMLVPEFGLPVAATRMAEFETDATGDKLVVDQVENFFGNTIQREISIERLNNGQLFYTVAFGPFIVYGVRCECTCTPKAND